MLKVAVEEPGVRPITIVAEEKKILDGCVYHLVDVGGNIVEARIVHAGTPDPVALAQNACLQRLRYRRRRKPVAK
jgi:hypothetical protein